MQGVGRALVERGFRIHDSSLRGFLVGGENATLSVTIPEHTCMVLTSVASPGIRDLDATMFSSEGELLTEDVEEDAHPTTMACADAESRRAHVVVRAYEGAGAFIVGAFVGSQAQLASVVGATGGSPGRAGHTHGEVAENAREREFSMGASRHGLTATREALSVTLAERQAVRIALPVDSGHCYSVGAFAGESLRDLDLRVLDDDAHEIVRDVGPSADAGVQFCADRGAEFAAEVTATVGSGSARLAIYAGRATNTGALSASWLGVRSSAERNAGSADSVLRPALATLNEQGYRALSTGTAQVLRTGGVIESTAQVPARSCVGIVTAVGGGLGRVALVARATDGSITANGQTRSGEFVSLTHVCAEQTARLDLTVSARSGGGHAIIALVSVPATAFPASMSTWQRARYLDAKQAHGTRGWQLANGEPRATTIDPAHSSSIDVPIAANACRRIALVGDGRSVLQIRAAEGVGELHAVGTAPELTLCATPTAARNAHVVVDPTPVAASAYVVTFERSAPL